MRAVFFAPALRASARVWSFVSFGLFACFSCIVRVVCRLRGVSCVAVSCLACFLRMVVASRAVFSMLCGLQGVFVFHYNLGPHNYKAIIKNNYCRPNYDII